MTKRLGTLCKMVAIALTLLALAGGGLYVYAQERHDLPPFDYEKAKQLSPTKRAEYERNLFNEVMYWNTGSPKYMERDGSGARRREADWLAMARDGYELAYITLQVLQPSTGIRYAVEKPLARLSELADGGDTGAMCLYPILSTMGTDRERHEYQEQARTYWRRGAEIGQPACLSHVGFFLMTGIQGFPRNVRAGFEASIKGARAGYDGAGSVAAYLARQRPKSAMNWTRYYCWQTQASRYSTYARPDDVLWQLKNQSGIPESESLAKRLEAWRPTLDECVELNIGDD